MFGENFKSLSGHKLKWQTNLNMRENLTAFWPKTMWLLSFRDLNPMNFSM